MTDLTGSQAADGSWTKSVLWCFMCPWWKHVKATSRCSSPVAIAMLSCSSNWTPQIYTGRINLMCSSQYCEAEEQISKRHQPDTKFKSMSLPQLGSILDRLVHCLKLSASFCLTYCLTIHRVRNHPFLQHRGQCLYASRSCVTDTGPGFGALESLEHETVFLCCDSQCIYSQSSPLTWFVCASRSVIAWLSLNGFLEELSRNCVKHHLMQGAQALELHVWLHRFLGDLFKCLHCKH